MSVVDRFKTIASDPKFKGWPLVGEYTLGEKIPFFGQVLEYNLETANGVERYVSFLRHFGWSVVFGVTTSGDVITLVQWKPGVNCASWELPPGGIGKVDPTISQEELLVKTQTGYLKETGYGNGEWCYLGHIMVETGKYRGTGPDDHGLPAHMFLATNLVSVADARQPNPNEIIEVLEVPLKEFEAVVDSGLFVEASALPCALLALRRLGKV